jgi:GNAT superfamily N-acetyltransferase
MMSLNKFNFEGEKRMLIREAGLDDSEDMAELSKQMGYKTTTEDVRFRLNKIMDDKNNSVFVILDDIKVIGWIHGFYTFRVESEPFTEIGGMVVDENYRREGIGRMLVNKIIEWSESKKSTKLRVRSNTIRKDTHSFYKGIGFVELKEQKVFDLNLQDVK